MTLAFLIIVLAAIGIDKVRRDNKDKRVSTHQISKLQEAIDDIRKRKTQDSLKSIAKEQTDSVKDAEFQRRLFEEFRITRDSVTNKPRQINFKTQINKARDVYIGSKN